MNIDNIDINSITEEDIDTIYAYLELEFKSMSDEDKLLWIGIMKLIDKEFNDYDNSNAEGLQ
jgi:hypothetical protein